MKKFVLLLLFLIPLFIFAQAPIKTIKLTAKEIYFTEASIEDLNWMMVVDSITGKAYVRRVSDLTVDTTLLLYKVDSITGYATQYDLTQIPNIDTTSLSDRINLKQSISDSNSVDATRYWVGQQGYVTGTPWVGLYWAYSDTTSTLETKAYSDSKLALKQSIANMVNVTSTSTTKYPTWYAAKAYADSVKGTVASSQWTTNGTAIYYNTGNVGIGVSAPTTKLAVSTDILVYSAIKVGRVGGSRSTGLGEAVMASTSSKDNTAIGYYALNALGNTGTEGGNTAVGSNAGSGITTTTYNTTIGYSSGGSGGQNTSIGAYSMPSCSGVGNIAIGYSAGRQLTSSHENVIIGTNAWYNNGNGYQDRNTIVGANAALYSSGLYARNNVALGYSALLTNSGSYNIAIGDSAGYTNGSLSNRMWLGTRDSITTGIFWNRTTGINKGYWNGAMVVKDVPYGSGSTTFKMVIQDTVTGQIKRQAIPSGSSGTVTSIATTSPITGGTITTTGTIAIHPDSLASWYGKMNHGQNAFDSLGNIYTEAQVNALIQDQLGDGDTIVEGFGLVFNIDPIVVGNGATLNPVNIDITGYIYADSSINPGYKTYGAVGTTENIYLTQGNTHTVTRDADVTLTLIGASEGTVYRIVLTHENSATAYTVAFSPTPKWIGGVEPTFTDTADAVDIVTLLYINGTFYGAMGADWK